MADHHDETIDELRSHGLRVAQSRNGYRFSLDPLLLCAFASPAGGTRVIDLGTGCGIIPLVLARMMAGGELVGVEHQPVLAEQAARNVTMNGLDGRIAILAADIMVLRERFPASSFDLVVSNPPFRKRGTGRLSPRPGRDLARHESTAGVADFLGIARYLVAPGGRICFIHHPSRLAELLCEAASVKLAPMRLRMVHGNPAASATMFMVELAKGRRGELQVEPPLIVRDADGGYSGEVAGILGEMGK